MSVAGSMVVEEARRYLGVPFRHQGRNASGLDCAGVPIAAARELGLVVYDVTGYQRNADGVSLVAHFRRAGCREILPVSAMADGDVGIFNDSVYPCHVAVFSTKYGARHMIHAYARERRVLEEAFAFDWPRKLIHVFRLPGVEG